MNKDQLAKLLYQLPPDAREIFVKDRRGTEMFFSTDQHIPDGLVGTVLFSQVHTTASYFDGQYRVKATLKEPQ